MRRPTPSHPPTSLERYLARALEGQLGANPNQPPAAIGQKGANCPQFGASPTQPGANVPVLVGSPPWPLPGWLEDQLGDWQDSDDDSDDD